MKTLCLCKILKILLLSNGKVFNIDVKKDESDNQNILSDVHQIALVQSCGDVLSLSKSRKNIKRIFRGRLVTRFISTKEDNESYECVGPAGRQAYACIEHSTTRGYLWYTKLSLLDEFGRILMSFTLDSPLVLRMKIKGFVCFEENKFIIIDDGKAVQASINDDSIKKGPHLQWVCRNKPCFVVLFKRSCNRSSKSYSFGCPK